MKKIFFASIALISLMTSCQKETEKKGNTVYKGPETQLHHGKAWTWIELNKDNVPERVAISLDDAALNSVPVGNGNGDTEHGHGHDNNVVLKFHPKADATPFKHVWLNWNPSGHEPAGVYTTPHFDIHYYTVSSEERETFVDAAKLDTDPAAGYVPANHIGVHPIPAMGKHWIDLASPELHPTNPLPFTQTFIFGSYNGKIVFYEPMITLDFLKNTQSFERPLPVPARFQQSGYYPTKMRVVKKAGVTDVILEDMVFRSAS